MASSKTLTSSASPYTHISTVCPLYRDPEYRSCHGDVPSDARLLRDRNARFSGLIKETPLVLIGLFLISRQKYRRRCSVCGRMTSATTSKGRGVQWS